MAAARPSAFAAVERGLDFEVGVDVGAELPRRGLPGDLADRDRAVGITADHDLAVGDLQVPGAGLDEERREVEHLGLQLPGAVQRDAAGHGGRPAAAGQPEGDGVAVADDDADLLERHAELVGGDLGEGGLVALPVRHLAGEQQVTMPSSASRRRMDSRPIAPPEPSGARGPGAASMKVATPMPR